VIRGSLARRYARALMAIGREKDIYERLGQEIAEVARLSREEESFGLVLKAAVVSREVRQKILDQLCQEAGFHEVTARFLQLLNEKGRLGQLEQIVDAYRELTDELEGRVRASVIAAEFLSSEAQEKIRAALGKITGKDVIMEIETDESLIGGVVARVGGRLLDGSVRTQLDAMEERLKTEGA